MRRAMSVTMWMLLALAVVEAQRPPGPRVVDAPAGGATVPMRSFGGRPAIDVMLNGHGPISFVLDTGAAGGAVDPDAVASIGLGTDAGVIAVAALGIGAVTLR